MGDSLSRGATGLRGCLALAFGVVALGWPQLTVAIVLSTFATYAIADGVFALAWVASSRREERIWSTALEAVLSIGAGLFVLVARASAAKLAFVCIGVWALITGVTQLMEPRRLQRDLSNETLVATSGAVRVLFGGVLLARRHADPRALVGLVALYAFIEGILMLRLAVGSRSRLPLTPA